MSGTSIQYEPLNGSMNVLKYVLSLCYKEYEETLSEELFYCEETATWHTVVTDQRCFYSDEGNVELTVRKRTSKVYFKHGLKTLATDASSDDDGGSGQED